VASVQRGELRRSDGHVAGSIASALIAKDNRFLNIGVVPLPKTWLHRTYSKKAPE
jgi:hypothetical protein